MNTAKPASPVNASPPAPRGRSVDAWFAKTSNTPPNPNAGVATRLENEWLNDAQKHWLGKLLEYGLYGGIAGAGVRAGLGVYDVVNQATRKTPKDTPPVVVDIPYRVKKPGMLPLDKTKQRGPSLTSKIATPEPKRVFDHDPQYQVPFVGGLFGQGATDARKIPLHHLSVALVPGLTALGGYSLMNYLINSQKKKEIQQELEESRSNYRQEMMGKLSPITLALDKESAAVKKAMTESTALDQVYEKKSWLGFTNAIRQIYGDKPINPNSEIDALAGNALFPINWLPGSVKEHITPWALLAGGLAGAGTGYMSYNYTRSHDPELEKTKQIKKQLEAGVLARDRPVFARLVPVDEAGNPVSQKQLKALKTTPPVKAP